jgi:EPS-associated MarR family transcriptional regulator
MAEDPEIPYNLFKILESETNLTQRQMAGKMGLSLGKFNYCLKELVKKGFVKVERFTSSNNKAAYMYLITPHGIEEKSKVTARFLKRKMAEFEDIKKQIEELKQEVIKGTNQSLTTDNC